MIFIWKFWYSLSVYKIILAWNITTPPCLRKYTVYLWNFVKYLIYPWILWYLICNHIESLISTSLTAAERRGLWREAPGAPEACRPSPAPRRPRPVSPAHRSTISLLLDFLLPQRIQPRKIHTKIQVQIKKKFKLSSKIQGQFRSKFISGTRMDELDYICTL